MLAGVAAGIGFFTNYWYNVREKPQVYFPRSDEFLSRVYAQLPILNEYYSPTFWCYNGHLNTLVGALIRDTPHVEKRREVIDLEDGGRLGLDWFGPADEDSTTPTLIFIPGLTGTSEAPYIRHIITGALEQGYRCVVMNFRGTHGIPLENHIVYSASWTNDYKHICQHVRDLYPDALLIGIGFSLGSNVLVKAACEFGVDSPLDSIISISNPYDCPSCSTFLSASPFYNTQLTKGCVRLFESKRDEILKFCSVHQIDISEEAILKCTTMRDYDEQLTRRIFGFSSVDEYYNTASCVQYLDNLKIPAFLISAVDDPIICPDTIPIQLAKSHTNMMLILTQRGGHVGFLEGVWPSEESWADRLVLRDC